MEKNVLEQHQTGELPRKDTPGWWETGLCTSTNF